VISASNGETPRAARSALIKSSMCLSSRAASWHAPWARPSISPACLGVLPLDYCRVPHNASGGKKCDHNVGTLLDDGFADPNKSAHSAIAPLCIVMVDAAKFDQSWSTDTLSRR
jgi:hypothetical protein